MSSTFQAGDEVSEHRRLTLTVPRVDVRLYQRTRTSADRISKPAHFQYIVRCDWSGKRREDIDFGSAEDLDAQEAGELCWWDTLPNTYVLRQEWADIRKLHNLIANELAFDQQGGYWRVKTRMPELPSPGDLDKFLVTLAASGDVMALNRRDGLQPKDTHSDVERRALQQLEEFHTIYVENRLGPYIAELNKILSEIPIDILAAAHGLRKFVTNGAACTVRAPDHLFFGPEPHFDPAMLAARVKIAKRSGGIRKLNQRPAAPQPVAAKPPPVQEASSGLRRAESSPELATHGSDLDHQSFSKEDEARKRRLESSHYGFFAQTLSKKDLAASNRDYWKRMVAKERRELGRRTLLMPLEEGTPPMSRSASAVGRLPMLPPPSPWGMKRDQPSMHRSGSGLKDSAQSVKESLSLSLNSRPAELALEKEAGQKDVITRDLCEGLRISLLGEHVSQVPRSIRLLQPMPVRPLPNEGETKKVYRLYCDLLAEEGLSPAAGDDRMASPPATSEQQHRSSRAFARSGSTIENYSKMRRPALVAKELTRISWKAILSWVQNQEDLSEDFRKRSVVAALNRALQNWRKKLASPRQRRSGVSLAMLISWIWPNVTDEHITRMMEWICMFELDKFRQPTPPLMDAQDRKVLESIFHTMDRHGKGSVLPEDIAGGKEGVADKLKNIVDAETVKAVIGEDRITLLPFLELMCENGVLAHEGAKQVWVVEDSSDKEGKIGEVRKKIVQQDRKAIGKKVWVFEGNPPEEEEARRLADVFEAEVLRWRTAAEASRYKFGEHGDRANEWEEDSEGIEGETDEGEEEELSAMMDGLPVQTAVPET